MFANRVFNALFRRTQRPPSLQQVKPEAGVTVVFHVLLSSNFKMTEESFFIRAHGMDLGDFKQNCVDMRTVEWVSFTVKPVVTSMIRTLSCSFMVSVLKKFDCAILSWAKKEKVSFELHNLNFSFETIKLHSWKKIKCYVIIANKKLVV